jgi:hypothetical protein
MSEFQWQATGRLGFALMITVIAVMKGLAWIGDRVTARAYAPLARAAGGHVDLKGPWIVMTHRGWRLRAALSGQTNDTALASRLEGHGVYEAVAAGTMPSTVRSAGSDPPAGGEFFTIERKPVLGAKLP